MASLWEKAGVFIWVLLYPTNQLDIGIFWGSSAVSSTTTFSGFWFSGFASPASSSDSSDRNVVVLISLKSNLTLTILAVL